MIITEHQPQGTSVDPSLSSQASSPPPPRHNTSSPGESSTKLMGDIGLGASSVSDLDEALLDQHATEDLIAHKVRRFLDQVSPYYPDNLYHLMMRKMEKPLIAEVLKRTGGNQLQASKILGINRLTLSKKMKLYSLSARTGPHLQQPLPPTSPHPAQPPSPR